MAPTSVAADKELQKEIDAMNQDKVEQALLQEGVEWHFIPSSAPHA